MLEYVWGIAQDIFLVLLLSLLEYVWGIAQDIFLVLLLSWLEYVWGIAQEDEAGLYESAQLRRTKRKKKPLSPASLGSLTNVKL